jgi:hypothetical protein
MIFRNPKISFFVLEITRQEHNEMEEKIVKEKIVKLNVGGVKYTTTTTTLSKLGGFFASLCKYDEQFETLKDENGRIFIDRDGEIFKYILNFLRSGEILCPPKFIYKLRIEAEFYQILELINQLEMGESELICLNVGGTKFTTTLQTLSRSEIMIGGYLYKLAEFVRGEKEDMEMFYDSEGNIFIDRDPDLFKYILSYVRNSTFPIVNKTFANVLNIEAMFYLGVANLMSAQINFNFGKNIIYSSHNTVGSGQEFPNFSDNLFQ